MTWRNRRIDLNNVSDIKNGVFAEAGDVQEMKESLAIEIGDPAGIFVSWHPRRYLEGEFTT